MLKNYGVLRVPSNKEEETEIVEKGLTEQEAKELTEEYKMSERSNPSVTYVYGNGKIFEE